MKYDTIKDLNELPVDVQQKVAEMVGGGFGCDATVVREFGEYSVNSFSCLKNNYADDHKVLYFNRAVVVQDPKLNEIVVAQDKEYDRWCKNEGKDFDWEAFGQ